MLTLLADFLWFILNAYYAATIVISFGVAFVSVKFFEESCEAWDETVTPGTHAYETSIKYPNLTAAIFTLMFLFLWPLWINVVIFGRKEK